MRRFAVVAVVVWLASACMGADCTKCKKPVAAGAKFCANCGTKQGPACPKCKKAVTPTAKFCASCGTKLAADKPKPKPKPKPTPKPTPKPKPKPKPAPVQVAGAGPFEPAWLAGRPNILNNANFENGAKGWRGFGSGPRGVDATRGRDGKSAAKVHAPAGQKAHAHGYEQALLAVMPGQRYYADVWCKTANVVGEQGAYLVMTFQAMRNGRWETVKGGWIATGRAKGTSDWQRLAVRATVPPDSQRLVIQVVLNANGAVWFDDARLVRFVTGDVNVAFDRAVGLAIAKGCEHLLKTMDPAGHWEPYGSPYVDRDLKVGKEVVRTRAQFSAVLAEIRRRLKPADFEAWRKRVSYDEEGKKYRIKLLEPDAAHNNQVAGPTALATYALLECGVRPKDPKVAKALIWLSRQRIQRTYSLALRANAFAAADRYQRGRYRTLVLRDARQIAASTSDGSYSYFARGQKDAAHRGWCNSNSQYGVLGVWAAAQVGAEIPAQAWRFFAAHWRKTQYPNGGWAYKYDLKADDWHNTPRGAMTLGGLASLFVCSDNLSTAALIKCGQDTEDAHIKRGLAWMEKNFLKDVDSHRLYYYAYGAERVGLASGYKYFGKQDWYRLLARRLLDLQEGNGRWGGCTYKTAFALLFLARGRNPVLYNKLRFNGDWNNRPRDLAQLTRWITYKFERPVSWQVINLQTPPEQWHDAPIVYLSGSKKFTLTDAEVAKLRTFVLQGGTIFSCTECRGRGFHASIRELYKRMFPQYELTPCDPKHPIYNVHFTLRGRPRFEVLSNGVRPLAIHSDDDLPLAWQFRKVATSRSSFEGPGNAFMYVTDKGRLRGRGVSHWPDKPTTYFTRTVRLARLKYAGSVDREPLAHERFARLMRRDCQTKVDLVGPVAIKDLPASGAKIASLSGTTEFKLTAAEIKTLTTWVAAGGTLVIDAMGGSKAFYDSALAMLRGVYETAGRVEPITAPIYQLPGFAIKRVGYRHGAAVRAQGSSEPSLRVLAVNGRPAIFTSREDITAGLLGVPASTIDGYDPASAFALMRNVTLHAAGVRAKAK